MSTTRVNLEPDGVNVGAVGETAPHEVRIHRGAHEIGGNCVELRHGQNTLVLDIGKPLTTTWTPWCPCRMQSVLTTTELVRWASSSATATRIPGDLRNSCHRPTGVHR